MRKHSLIPLTALVLVFTIFLFSCNPNEGGNPYSYAPFTPAKADTIKYNVTGTLYQNCTHTPATNHQVVLLLKGQKQMYDTTYTDSNGTYAFKPIFLSNQYGNNTPFPDNLIFPQDSLQFFIGNSYNKTIPNIVLRDTFNLNISANVSGTYSSSDTLYYGVSGTTAGFVIGPFTTGLIGTVKLNNRNASIINVNSEVYSLQYAIGFNRFKYRPYITQFNHTQCVSTVGTTIYL